MPRVLPDELQLREQTGNGRRLQHSLCSSRTRSLDFSQRKLITTQHDGAITQLDLDFVENRYLLAGAADATVAAYDTCYTFLDNGNTERCLPVLKIARNNRDCHKYSITSLTWYPIDSGLFVTGSLDEHVKVWDTNTVQAACTFPFETKVYAVGMSPVASAHCLVAVAGAQPQIKLCDPSSGSFTHVLGGHEGSHREDVWALHWSLQNEWHLTSGGCDGQVRLWDIRRSCCFQLLDEQHTDQGAPRPAPRRQTGSRGSRPAKIAVAHEGQVTAVMPLTHGQYWLTAGTDSRLRLWSTKDFRNMLVNYSNTWNRATKARQIAFSMDASLIFHPSGSAVQVLDMFTGTQFKLLRGHLDTINACTFNARLQELYTGADDASILVWSQQESQPSGDDGADERADVDAWSD